jgi:NADH:ubiquinone oxidoreductase subunit D
MTAVNHLIPIEIPQAANPIETALGNMTAVNHLIPIEIPQAANPIETALGNMTAVNHIMCKMKRCANLIK